MAAMCPITSWIGGPAHLRDDAAQPAMSRIGVDTRMPVEYRHIHIDRPLQMRFQRRCCQCDVLIEKRSIGLCVFR